MDIPYLIQVLNNKLAVLTNGKVLAFNSGDLETINKLDIEIISTQNTLNQLVMLQTINSAANAINTTPAQLISNGIEMSQNKNLSQDNSIASLEIYDISSYATDPMHEQKIADILRNMGQMATTADIDAYIDKEAIGSPINGHMILTSASKYSVDVRLIMALIEQDSNFGTAGIAIQTFNPGNVGNTGTSTRTYDSWESGVDAVAMWLNDHRVSKVPETTNPIPPETNNQTPPATVDQPDNSTINNEVNNQDNITEDQNTTTNSDTNTNSNLETTSTTTDSNNLSNDINNTNASTTDSNTIPSTAQDNASTTSPTIIEPTSSSTTTTSTTTPDITNFDTSTTTVPIINNASSTDPVIINNPGQIDLETSTTTPTDSSTTTPVVGMGPLGLFKRRRKNV